MRKNTSDFLYNEIINDFLNENLKYGDKIVELDLCTQYGTSRTPLREALAKLEKDGLVERQVNNRLQIVTIDENILDEILDLRLSLESMVLKYALKYSKETTIFADLHENLDLVDFYLKQEDVVTGRKILSKFSEILYKQSRLKYTTKLIENYNLLLYPLRTRSLMTLKRLYEAQEEHKHIYELLKDANLAEVQKFNIYHLQTSMDSMRKQLKLYNA
ncbi:MAG: GntR family transcriptional regulator [Acidaminococcaceae bacterium]